ncbi:hypothetical protein I316_01597 [Kwoniella heveanensis BCC8398]|uniref:Cyclase n=1 Tax=Kwoniella heveanensis BCC8398 TaxID=1296120 RepID=A0A1B9H155_9TREE|nr:hypothetical protein I316_01597 [Kwoniella heveanensis BCC8398]
MPSFPPFSALPLKKDGPPHNAWGLYSDAEGDGEDELGRLNLISPQSVKRGKETITEGLVINLNLPLSFPPLHPRREHLQHEIKCSGHSNDDVVRFNTQSSTQWDGFRHYPYQDWPGKGEYTFYGGMSIEEASDSSVKKYGAQNYAKRPITSRAHLLDIPLYLSTHSLPPLDPFSSSQPIPLSTLKACAEDSQITFAEGDILLVNTGFIEALEGLSDEEREGLKKREKNESVGVEANEEVWAWHWDNGIAAVASDCPSYESWPAPDGQLSCHQVFLAGFGLPIGELFDLRELAEQCKRLNRWTFFFASCGLYVDGGIATPPNAQAIL